MTITVKRQEMWAATIEDRPGGLQKRLQPLTEAGVNLHFVLARRRPDHPGTGVVFVAPVKGTKQQRAAEAAGFAPTVSLSSLVVEAADQPGVCAAIAGAVSDAGVNMRGMSGLTHGKKAVIVLAFDNPDDASKALRAIGRLK